MSFNITNIPPEGRTKSHIAAHMEMYTRTQDIIRVHNPSDEDFIINNDRMVTNESWVIPNKNKDLGKGKGNFDVPRYIAIMYLNRMGTQMISEVSAIKWEEIKKNYRADERGTMEERLAIRTNSIPEWKKITPILWKGVVSRYQSGNMEALPPEKDRKKSYSLGEETLDMLDLEDAEIGLQSQEVDQLEETKNKFIKDIT